MTLPRDLCDWLDLDVEIEIDSKPVLKEGAPKHVKKLFGEYIEIINKEKAQREKWHEEELYNRNKPME